MDNVVHRKTLGGKVFPYAVILLSVLLTLFQHWEMSHETSLYWFFSRVLAQTGRFPILQRGPLYSLYLMIYHPLEYPSSVIAEYIITTFISTTMLYVFMKRFTFRFAALLFSVLWVPYLQVSEPSPQKLALACSLAAITIRLHINSRKIIVSFYALLIMAYLFRPIYGVPILVFAIWDLIRYMRNHGSWNLFKIRPRLQTDWPLYTIIVFIGIVLIRQSPHPWNNVFASTPTWFPGNAKSFSILQNYNGTYIYHRFKTFLNHDFYITNKELFGDANGTVAAIRNNPAFVWFVASGEVTLGIPVINNMTLLPQFLGLGENVNVVQYLLFLAISLLAIVATRQIETRIYILSLYVTLLVTFIIISGPRHYVFFIPLLGLSAIGLEKSATGIVKKIAQLIHIERVKQINSTFRLLLTCIVIVIYSHGSTATIQSSSQPSWPLLLSRIRDDLQNGELAILESRQENGQPQAIKGNVNELQHIARTCHGIMTLEHTLIAAFIDIPIDQVYDIWEIPPFDTYNHSTYNKLTPDRINCIFVSKEMRSRIGTATNINLRYKNYVLPYAEHLLKENAKSIVLKGYGWAIVYPDNR